MIDQSRLAALRDRFASLRGDYVRMGDEVAALAKQCASERADLCAALVGSITAEHVRRNVDHAKLEPERFATDPLTVTKVSGMTYAELEAAGVKPAQINSVRARETVLARKRTAHAHVGARVRVWAAYMEGVERLAAEYSA